MIVVIRNDTLHTQQVVSMSFRLSVHWEDLLQSQLQSSYIESDEDSNNVFRWMSCTGMNNIKMCSTMSLESCPKKNLSLYTLLRTRASL